jgi:hypothetical protein
MDLRLLVPKNVGFGKCPKCNAEMTLERVKTNTKFEKTLLSLIRFKKYHCKSCKWYGNMFIYTFSRNIKKVFLNYLYIIIMVIVVSFLISLFVKKVLSP